jgi:hypothetical protein
MDNRGLGMIRVEEIWGYSQTTKLNIMSHWGGRGSFKRELQRNAVPTNTTPPPFCPDYCVSFHIDEMVFIFISKMEFIFRI